MELRHLRYFVAVAEELHFSRAARRLAIAQPPLSRQIRALEMELGVTLFERKPRALRLTPGGEAFLEGARRVLAEAERATERTRSVARGELGKLVVGHVESPLHGAMIGALVRAFQARFPGVELELRAADSVTSWAAVRAGEIDAAVTWWQPWYAAGLSWQRLADDPFSGVLLSGRHPLAQREVVRLCDLSAYPFYFIPRAANPPMHDHLLSALAERGVTAAPLRTTSTYWVMTGLVAETEGWLPAPRSALALPAAGTVFRTFEEPAIPSSLALVWSPERPNACLERLIDVAAELGGDVPPRTQQSGESEPADAQA